MFVDELFKFNTNLLISVTKLLLNCIIYFFPLIAVKFTVPDGCVSSGYKQNEL